MRNYRLAMLRSRPDHVHHLGPSGPGYGRHYHLCVQRAARIGQRDGYLENNKNKFLSYEEIFINRSVEHGVLDAVVDCQGAVQ